MDFKDVTRESRGQTYDTKSPFRLAMEVPKNTKKRVLDIWISYHSVMIKEEDRDKTAFVTVEGTYSYLRASQDYLVSGDGFTHRELLIARYINKKVKLVDSSLLLDKTVD